MVKACMIKYDGKYSYGTKAINICSIRRFFHLYTNRTV